MIIQNCSSSSNVAVTFQPATQAAAAYAASLSNSSCANYACLGLTYQFPDVLYIRKKQSDFGTDSGPAFSPAGIWKSVKVVQLTKPAIHIQDTSVDLYLQTQINNLPPDQNQPWIVNATIDFIGSLPGNASMEIKICDEKRSLSMKWQSTTLLQTNGFGGRITRTLQLAEQPDLWWPVGYGNQSIYQMDILVKNAQNAKVATVTKHIGFRTIVLDQRPITTAEIAKGTANGSRWNFEINGHEIYCKGSNFVPPDAFWPRVTVEDIENLFESVVDSVRLLKFSYEEITKIIQNQNMVRIWGGGIYVPERVMTIADNMGIMLWQELRKS
jgi:beta-mannosidase